MPPRQHFDLSSGRFTISASDLVKLIGVVIAIATAYAMAASRLTMIEKGMSDDHTSITALQDRVSHLEDYMAAHESANNDVFHEYDLRLQSVEQKVFGRATTTSVPRRTDPQYSSVLARSHARVATSKADDQGPSD